MVRYTPLELLGGLPDRRQVTQIHLDEMEVVLSSFFLQFLDSSISFRLGPSENVYCCILDEELLETRVRLRRSVSERVFSRLTFEHSLPMPAPNVQLGEESK